MNHAKSISVLLVEDHAIVREGLRLLLGKEPDIHIIGESATGSQAVELATKSCPEVIVSDIAVPLLSGLEIIQQFLTAVPSAKILILSAHCDDVCVQHALHMGVMGYLVKDTPACFLSEAIRDVYHGRTFYSPGISRHLCADNEVQGRNGSTQKKSPKLTLRELEVLQLVAEGNGNKQMAAELGISPKTVEKHRGHLEGKLKIHGTANLTRYAMGLGILQTSVR